MRYNVFAFFFFSLFGCTDRAEVNKKGNGVAPADAFHNPVDNKTYVAPGGWKSYQPAVPRPDEPGKKVKTDQIRLLTAQENIATQTTAQELSSFIKKAERLAEETFAKSGKQFRLMVQFTCNSAGHAVKIAHQGDTTQELLQRYHDGLIAMKKLSVRDGEVSFQLELSVSP